MYQNVEENMNRTQRELLEMKKFEMKNTLDRINTKLDTTEKKNELKTQQKMEKKNLTEFITELRDSFKQSSTRIIGIPKGEVRQRDKKCLRKW